MAIKLERLIVCDAAVAGPMGVSVTAPLTDELIDDNFLKCLVISISGDPGSYWLSIDIQPPENHPPGYRDVGSPEYFSVPSDGSVSHRVVELFIQKPVPGLWKIVISLANKRLGRIEFGIQDKGDIESAPTTE